MSNRQSRHRKQRARERAQKVAKDFRDHYRLGVENFERVTGRKPKSRRGCGGGRR